MKDFNFDDAPAIDPKPVKYQGRNYELREASAGTGAAYRNFQLQGITLEDGKPKKLKGLASGDILLVSKCLFEVKENKYRPVNVDELSEWKEKDVREMSDWIKEVSNLNEDDQTVPEGLRAAFNADGAPITFEELQDYVLDLPDEKEFKNLRKAFKKTEEERAKN